MRLDFSRYLTNAFIISAALALTAHAPACNTNPLPIVERQPDGSLVTVFFKGDKFYNWYEDEKGYTIVQLESDKSWHYADVEPLTGRMQPTKLLVGRDAPAEAGLKPGTQPDKTVIQEISSQVMREPEGFNARAAAGPQGVPPTGTVKNLVVLMQFSDHVVRGVRPPADYDTLFNASLPEPIICPTGSVKAFYSQNSYGAMSLESTVVAWVTLPNTEIYYANGASGLTTRTHDAIRAALALVDPIVDFDEFDTDNNNVIDSIAFVHSGYGAENGGTDFYGATQQNRMWSHRWSIESTGAFTSAEGVQVTDYHINPGVWGTSGNNIGRVGVIVHETGHFFGLPDLYDTDSTAGEGAGSWSVMANSWGFTGNQYNPPHFDGWSKTFLGWVTPTVLSTPGVYNLTGFNITGECYKITHGYPANEYLLLESRVNTGFETTLPQQGLVIFHIDNAAGYNTQGWPGQTGWPTNGLHYRVSVLQADGNYNLEKGNNRGDAGDVWHAGGRNQIGNFNWSRPGGNPAVTTYPNTDSYQGGAVASSRNRISEISVGGGVMSFRYSNEDLLKVTPVGAWVANGFQGGDIAPSSKSFTLQNMSASPIQYSVAPNSAWLTASTTGGTLLPGGSINLDSQITIAGNCLPAGINPGVISIQDVTNGVSSDVPVYVAMNSDKDCDGNGIGDSTDAAFPLPPGADTCSNASYVTTLVGYGGTTATATNDGQSFCGDTNASNDVWYRYKPLTSGTVTVSLCAAGSYDTVLSIHSGCPGTTANSLACNDDGGGCAVATTTSAVTLAVTANVEYLIRIGGWGTENGNYSMTLTGPKGFIPAGPNDLNGNGIPDTCETAPDLDSDGKPNSCETTNVAQLNSGLYTNSVLKDSDGDGISDGQESSCDCYSLAALLTATNPRKWDTDNDGWGDGLERLFPGTFVNGPLVADAAFPDSDGDGLPDSLDANDVLSDSDGDLFSDSYEVAQGTNPSSAASRPSTGDVNGSGTFDVADVALLADYNLGLATPSAPWNSDLSLNGIVDLADVAMSADVNLGLAVVGP